MDTRYRAEPSCDRSESPMSPPMAKEPPHHPPCSAKVEMADYPPCSAKVEMADYPPCSAKVEMANYPSYDANDGIEMLVSDTPPAHYTVKIQSFSLLAKNNIDKYESGIFQAGGYKWKLILYPNGNKTKKVREHVSVYLSMAETCSLSPGWEVHAVVRVFLLDQDEDNYLIVQDAMRMPRRFHWMKPESGFDQFIPLKTLTDPQNGYLVDDTCVLGAEVFVSKERSTGKGESLVMLKDGLSHNKYLWKIDNYSGLRGEYYNSNTFTAGNYKWNIRFHPNGKGIGLGNYISLYLNLAEAETLPPGEKVFAEFSLRILDQVQGRNFTGKASHWFSSSNPESGWARFISLITFKQQGPLNRDSCLVEAEVSVLGTVNPHS